MSHPNLNLIDQFFAAYGQRDVVALRTVLAEEATWSFPGHHPLSGTRVGIDAIISFFDAVGSVMGVSNPTVERLVMGVNDHYVIECQHVRTNRTDGPNLDQRLCVVWSFANGKIVGGQHLVADQEAFDAFYTKEAQQSSQE